MTTFSTLQCNNYFSTPSHYVYLFHDAPLCHLSPRCVSVSTFSVLLLRYGYFFHAAVLCLFFLSAPLRLLSCADPGIFVGKGVGSRSIRQKKSFNNCFFSLVLSLFYRSQMVHLKENYQFSRFLRGSNFFQERGGGVQLFPGRGPIAYTL